MRFGLKVASSLFIILFSTLSPQLGAQSLPSLPKASEAVVGTLPDGIAYYLVPNPKAAKGRADFALVQKGFVQEEVSRAALCDLPHFQSAKPYQFLAKLGVSGKKEGFVSFSPSGTTYIFENVPVEVQADRDTMLLLLFDLAQTSPFEQAIIVSGDIDKTSVQERMGVFSMMVGPRQKSPSVPPAPWQPSDSTIFNRTPQGDVATLAFSWSAPRTPKEAMGTVQPLVTRLYAEQLGMVVRSRLEDAFEYAGIPIASLGTSYRGSADAGGDEEFSFSLVLRPGDVARGAAIAGAVISRLDARGVTEEELKAVRSRLLRSLSSASDILPNADWVKRCSASFLYGAAILSPGAEKGFLSSRSIGIEREKELFDSFVSALFDGSRALTISCAEDVREAFAEGWKTPGEGPASTISFADTLSFASPKGKSKLRKTVSDPVTGGQMWTFANGMKVIFAKNTQTPGRFSYGFMIRGGYAGLPALGQGEGGFVSDLLLLEDISGMKGKKVVRLLDACGISMSAYAGLADLRITGDAPSSGLALLLSSLLSISSERELTPEAYGYYAECERLRLSVEASGAAGVSALVDSVMCPGNLYSSRKLAEGLAEDLPQRAEKYFAQRFDACDDGVLVLVGDLDEYALKKLLPKYVGDFATAGSQSSRPQIQYVPRSGWSTYTTPVEESPFSDRSVEVAQSVCTDVGADRYYAMEVAALEVEHALAEALTQAGVYAESSAVATLMPAEMLSLRVSCHETPASALPSDIAPSDPLRTLGLLRTALSQVSEAPSSASVKTHKAEVLARYEHLASQPSFIVDAALKRYAVGKDFFTGYKERINAVSPASVKEVLSALDGGTRVEIVIY